MYTNTTTKQSLAEAGDEMLSLRAEDLMICLGDLARIKRLAMRDDSLDFMDEVWRLADAVQTKLERRLEVTHLRGKKGTCRQESSG